MMDPQRICSYSDNRTRQQRKDVKELLASQIACVATIFRIEEGLLPPLDAPHHLHKHEWAPYCEECFDWIQYLNLE
ncbi:hypothetical protein ACSBR2_002190 [Camellia fascicularis]